MKLQLALYMHLLLLNAGGGANVFGVVYQQNSNRSVPKASNSQSGAMKNEQEECECLNAEFPKTRRLVSVGVLNAKAIVFPKPEYPTNAKAARISGEVKYEVVINDVGRVAYARPVNGHPLLQQAADKVICHARFEPKTIGGQAFHVRAIIVYNFVLP